MHPLKSNNHQRFEQSFQYHYQKEYSCTHATALKEEIDRQGLSVSIQVDGGINATTAVTAAAAGADNAVMGSALFNAADPQALVAAVQAL